MRKLRTYLLMVPACILLFPACCLPASLKISWNANTEKDLSGYIVHIGTRSGSYDLEIDTGNVTCYQIDDVQAGLAYYIALTAYDFSGNESALSEEKSVSIPSTITPVSPVNGAYCSSSPTLVWSGAGFKSFKVYLSITSGLIYTQIYSGPNTSVRIDPILVWLFIPWFAEVTWYVEGSAANDQVVKSKPQIFYKR